jgi:GTP pyrophosphokinase
MDQREILNRVVQDNDFRTLLGANKGSLDQEKILLALEFATKAHGPQMRKSGDPYITHPMGVAALLIKENLDTDTICGALLHDVVEDTETTAKDIKKAFGADVARLVEGVTKIGRLQFTSKAEQQAESIRKMMLAMTDDLRVILIKLGDRLHNMHTLQHMPVEKQQRIARETLDIYAPIARRLGISKIQWALEDICLRCMNPKVYWDLVRRVAQKRHEREKFVDSLRHQMAMVLGRSGVQGVIRGRPKSFYSIYKKTLERDKNLQEIYDLIGLRILVKDLEACYAALGVIHKTWKPLQNRFKDYIAVPKSNLYQSLHTTVIHPDGHVFEVQIRTFEMDQIAEKGVAAHWAYKEGLAPHEQAKRKMTWLNQIIGWAKDTQDSSQFIENVRLDLFQDQVYVFTPQGRVIEMSMGATALDFAYFVHTEVGNRCVGVQVNGKMVPLETRVENGDVISVATSKSSKGPSRDWLNIVQTNRAKSKIRTFLRKQHKEEYRVKGREALLAEIERLVRILPKEDAPTIQEVMKHKDLSAALSASGFQDLDEAYQFLGRGDCQPSQILSKLELLNPPTVPITTEDLTTTPLKRRSIGGVLVAGQGDMLVRLSKCCNPVIGDDIVGYITRGRGVSVHRRSCPNVQSLGDESSREVEVNWDEGVIRNKDATFLAEIEIQSHDQPNVLARVTNVISNFKINIYTANARVARNGVGVLTYTLEIRNALQLKNLMEGILHLPEIQEVYRVQPGGGSGSPGKSKGTGKGKGHSKSNKQKGHKGKGGKHHKGR